MYPLSPPPPLVARLHYLFNNQLQIDFQFPYIVYCSLNWILIFLLPAAVTGAPAVPSAPDVRRR